MINKGLNGKGFMVCKDCGAAMPGDDIKALNDIQRPYKSKYIRTKCKHSSAINVNLGYDFITDMFVLEFAIDDTAIDVHNENNLWLNRAAQSLAEAFRLVTSKKLDIEFTELVTGYRFRGGENSSFIDIYLYDSLSSGAGYAVSVADNVEEILSETKMFLESCSCSTSCSKCLKHYKNQNVHGVLDRFAAVELLNWGICGEIVSQMPVEVQYDLIKPLSSILEKSGHYISVTDKKIIIEYNGKVKEIIVYPAMWMEPQKQNTICLNDAYLKYAKPYAVQKILDSI